MDSWRHGDEKYANAIGQFVAYTGLHIALFRAGTIIFMQDIERGRMGKLKDMGETAFADCYFGQQAFFICSGDFGWHEDLHNI